MTILLTLDQQATIRATHELAKTPDGEFYYQPYCLHDCGSGKFEKISHENLPDSVKEFLTQRGIKQ